HALTVAGTEILQLDRHHEFFFPPRIRDMKKGTPISEVTTPMGKMAPGIRVLLTTELADRINAPVSKDAGRKNRWSSPISIRAMCGPTSPINPIVPTKATGNEASRLTMISV